MEEPSSEDSFVNDILDSLQNDSHNNNYNNVLCISSENTDIKASHNKEDFCKSQDDFKINSIDEPKGCIVEGENMPCSVQNIQLDADTFDVRNIKQHDYFSSTELLVEEINAKIFVSENVNLNDLLNSSSVELIVEEPNNIIEEKSNGNEEEGNAEDATIEEFSNENGEEGNAEDATIEEFIL